MNEKEIAELRRRFRPEKSGISRVCGCYVNENREIVSRFDQSLGLMSQEESEKILAILKRTLSGTPGKNLTDLTFQTKQVVDSDEHRLLMALRDSRLHDQEAIDTLFQKAIGALDLEGNYLILLAYDTYDVPYRSKDGQRQDDAGDECYSYILCSVCPVKLTKPALSYYVDENAFHNLSADWIVAPPEVGFLFPAFDDRTTNLYGALYYTRSAKENYSDFAEALFHLPLPMPGEAQKETFQELLSDTLEEECSYEVVQAMQDRLCALIEAHKEAPQEEPAEVSRAQVSQMLADCGISQTRMAAFEMQYDAAFGVDAKLAPVNLVDAKQMAVSTPNITIRFKPEYSDLVETRIIDGVRYILIRADDGVEVNGISIRF